MRWLAPILFVNLLYGADVIDRVAVSIGLDVITESEVLEQIRLTAFQNGREPDYSAENRRAIAEKLVEQYLLRREVLASRFAPEITNQQIDEIVSELRTTTYKRPNSFQTTREQLGLSDKAIRRQIEWQLTLVPFVDTRFRPSVPIPDAEIQEYYENVFLAQWKTGNKGEPPSLESVRDRIDQILTSQRADQALDRWLGQARTQQRIIFHDEALR